MASLAQTRFRDYVEALNKCSLLAQRDFATAWERIRDLPPNQCRDALLLLMDGIIPKYGNMAAVAASDYYRMERLSAGYSDDFAIELSDGVSTEQIEASTRYACGHLFEDSNLEYDPEKTAAYLAGKVDEYVKESARDTISRNAKREKHARYARIPDGNACDFCRMLGSRGFVYHSEAKAKSKRSTGEKYHPFCNCQIAVSFDPAIVKYQKGWTTVTRGYEDNPLIVEPGRDGSLQPRDVDIDELYDEYLKAGKSFNDSAKYKNYSSGSKLSEEKFNEAMQKLSDAQTLDELYKLDKEILDDWPKDSNGLRNKRQFNEMSRHAKELEKQLKAKAEMPAQAAVANNQEIKEAVEYYASGEGMYINQFIRRGQYDSLTDEEKELVKKLDEATQADIVEAPKLYRSVDASSVFGNMSVDEYVSLTDGYVYNDSFAIKKTQAIRDRVKTGDVITEKGFMSTSEDYDVVSDWYDFTGSDRPITLELTVPDNTRGCKVYELTPEVEETDPQREILLPRNTKYKITEITTRDGLIYVKADIVR